MVNRLLLSALFALTLILAPITRAVIIDNPPDVAEEDIDVPNMTFKRMIVNKAAVKISTPSGGHGSGTLFKYKGHTIVITAAHVIDDDGVYVVETAEGSVTAKPVYFDELNDLGVLHVMEDTMFSAIKHLRIKLRLADMVPGIGTDVYHSSFPADYTKQYFEGTIAGYERYEGAFYIIMNGWAWPGSSGSVVFNKKGQAVGIISAIDIRQIDPFYSPQALPSVVWLRPLSLIDKKILKQALKDADVDEEAETTPEETE